MTADSERCPRCSSDRVIAGHASGANGPAGFCFGELRLSHSLKGSLPIGRSDAAAAAAAGTPNAHACCDCGLVWSEVDATELRFRLREGGTAEIKHRLRLDQAPPTPDGRPVFPRRGGRDPDAAG